MTKVVTAYTCLRIIEELGMLDLATLKNTYLRTSKKAAFTGGTSAYL